MPKRSKRGRPRIYAGGRLDFSLTLRQRALIRRWARADGVSLGDAARAAIDREEMRRAGAVIVMVADEGKRAELLAAQFVGRVK